MTENEHFELLELRSIFRRIDTQIKEKPIDDQAWYRIKVDSWAEVSEQLHG